MRGDTLESKDQNTDRGQKHQRLGGRVRIEFGEFFSASNERACFDY